jgi:hypothetical protein
MEIQVTPEMLPLENLTTQHDPLTVRVLLMDDGRARQAASPGGGRAITADLAGSAAYYVEKWHGADTVALFVMEPAVTVSGIEGLLELMQATAESH